MSVGSLARPFQPDNPRLHHHAAHPLAWATLLGRTLQPIGCRLASADTATSPFPGPVPTTPTSPVAPHLRGRQRTAVCFCCRLQDLVHKRCRAPPRAGPAIANAAGSRVKVGGVVVAHTRRGCASSGPTQAQTGAPRAMSLKKKGNAIRPTLHKIEAGKKTMCRQDLTGKRKFALILLS